MTTAEELHRLVDELPEQEHHAARRFLEYLRDHSRDPVWQAFLNAPVDDEPLTDEDIAAIREGEEAIARGEVRPWEDVRAELLAQADTPPIRRRKRVQSGVR